MSQVRFFSFFFPLGGVGILDRRTDGGRHIAIPAKCIGGRDPYGHGSSVIQNMPANAVRLRRPAGRALFLLKTAGVVNLGQ